MTIDSISMDEYAAGLARNGVRTVAGTAGSCWIRHEVGAMLRVPTFCCSLPSARELRRVFWRGRSALAGYLLEPDAQHPANAWLYICQDRAYGLEALPPPVRRSVRRGLQAFNIASLTLEQLLASGCQAFHDTMQRAGFHSGGMEAFRRNCLWRAKFPGHTFLGAWKDGQLAAFLSMIAVDDWLEVEGSYSMDAFLHLRPNDALLFSALSSSLTSGRCRLVSYGLSSIQPGSDGAGLHFFKTKLGFEARPVHRAFAFHPLLRPFANRLMQWALKTALRVKPGNRRLQKAAGVMACLRGETRMPAILEKQER
jgi:hypothetical protein